MSSSSAEPVMTRDRLQDFVALRKAARRQEEWLHQQQQGVSSSSAGTPDADHNAATGTAPPSSSSGRASVSPPWVRALEHFGDLEATVVSRVERLHQQQREFFAPKFLSSEEEEDVQRELDGLAADIQKLLKELERMVLTGVRPADANNVDESLCAKNVQRHLGTRLTAVMSSFRDGQQLFVDQLRKRKDAVKKFQTFGDAEVHTRMEREEKVATYLELGYSQVEIQELLEEEERQKEVSHEVQNILESIKELHEMFKDLNAMVVEQGTILDRIDHNIMKASANTASGLKELKKAREHQKKCSMQ